MNKTQAMVVEDLKLDILAKLNDEEIGLWHGAGMEDVGWNKALERVAAIVRFEV